MSGIVTVLEAEITPDTSAYSAGDVVGGLIEFDQIETVKLGGSILQALSIMDDDNEGAGFNVHLFYEEPLTIADQAPFAPSLADLKKRSCVVEVATGDYKTVNSLKIAHLEQLTEILPRNRVYAYLVCVGTPTFAANKTVALRLFVVS